MMLEFKPALERSLTNIIGHGDTDVFPFPLEKNLFEEKRTECTALLCSWSKDFIESMSNNPPCMVDTLCQVGYSGFRYVTQIEPFWNAYYLALVIQLAQEIEVLRIPTSEQKVFSYRYDKDGEKSLFQKLTWIDYRKRAVELTDNHDYVVMTDISDFYPRVNHHRLENALKRTQEPGDICFRILQLLKTFSNNKSYGLPIGGPASRLLSELALVDVDRLLRSANVPFCRYADDFTLFCSSPSLGLKLLADLAEVLALEGLSLQKQKTKIMRKEEFLQMNAYLDPAPDGSMEQKLLGISLKYDPYSPTAEEDYLALKASVAEIDIVGLLSNEVAKTTIDPMLTRQALKALHVLEPDLQAQALSVLLMEDNIHILSPVFPHVMRIVRGIYDGLSISAKDSVDNDLLALIDSDSHVLSIELNRLFLVQVLSRRHSVEKERALFSLFSTHENPLLRRMIIHALANWDCGYLVRSELEKFTSTSLWERRALIVGSYQLGDHGKHWRQTFKNTFNEVERLLCDWVCEREQNDRVIPV